MSETDQGDEQGIFDGEIVARNLERFLSRMNNALRNTSRSMPDFEVKEIWLSLTVGVGGTIGFAGMGANLSRDRTFQFILTPKPGTNP